MDVPGAPMPPDGAPQDRPSPVGQQIVQAAQKPSPDDLDTLKRGISPEACEIMGKIPELSAFSDFIENSGKDYGDDQAPGKKPGVAIIIGVGKPRDPREDVRAAAAQHGLK